MVTSDSRREEFPCAVVVTDTGGAAGLIGSAVGEEVSVSDCLADAQAVCGVAVSVDRLNVDGIVAVQPVGTVVP